MGFFEQITSWFSDTFVSWHHADEWAKVSTTVAHEVVAEHEQSWDVEVWWVYVYRHKDTGEKRIRKGTHKDLGETHTTFTDPTDRNIEWSEFGGTFKSVPLERLDETVK